MILVCGQNCAWQLIYRFERVTAGAVNRVREVQRAAAGKGINVARALTALGLPATLLAYLGGANGRRMRAALRDEGIAARVVETASDTRTCVTLLEGPAGAAARQVTELVEPAAAADGAAQERFAEAYDELLASAAAVVISGTANCRSVVPGLVTCDLVRQLAAQVTIAESRP